MKRRSEGLFVSPSFGYFASYNIAAAVHPSSEKSWDGPLVDSGCDGGCWTLAAASSTPCIIVGGVYARLHVTPCLTTDSTFPQAILLPTTPEHNASAPRLS